MSISLYDTEAYKRLRFLFDDGIFTELDAYVSDAVVCGYGTVSGIPCYAFSQNPDANKGAVDKKHGAKIKKVYDLAAKTGCPIIGVYDSNGLSLENQHEAIAAYGDILKSAASVSGVIPQISVIAGSCLGTSALMANMGDVVIAPKYAEFYITAPSEFSAEDNSKAGTVDILTDDFEAAANSVKAVVALLPENNLSPVPVLDFAEPSSNDYASLEAIADEGSVLELKKNYAENVRTALATVAGRTAGFVSFSGNALNAASAYKAEAFIKFCDAYNIPLVTVADASGFENNSEAQLLTAATKLTTAYATATTAKISLITNESIGGAYIALAGKGANADITLAWENAVVSPLGVEASVAFLYGERLAAGENRAKLEEEYRKTSGSALSASENGAVDDVFSPELTRSKVIAALDMLSGKRETTIPRKHSVK